MKVVCLMMLLRSLFLLLFASILSCVFLCSQSGFHILPPQDVFEPSIRAACGRLYSTAENVLLWILVDM